MGADGQHVKLMLRDQNGKALQMLAFNAPEGFFRQPGDEVVAWFQPTVNEWQGCGRLRGGCCILNSSNKITALTSHRQYFCAAVVVYCYA